MGERWDEAIATYRSYPARSVHTRSNRCTACSRMTYIAGWCSVQCTQVEAEQRETNTMALAVNRELADTAAAVADDFNNLAVCFQQVRLTLLALPDLRPWRQD